MTVTLHLTMDVMAHVRLNMDGYVMGHPLLSVYQSVETRQGLALRSVTMGTLMMGMVVQRTVWWKIPGTA